MKAFISALYIYLGPIPPSAFESLIMEADYSGSSTRTRITIRFYLMVKIGSLHD